MNSSIPMDVSEPSFHRFIDLVYEAAENPAHWRRFYDALQQALGVQSIHVLGTDKRHGTLSYSDGANMPVEGELAYLQHYRFMDPRVPAILQRDAGEWTHCHEILDEGEVARHPFYQEFLIPYDRRYMSGTKLVDTPEATIIFATLSSTAQGPLSGEALAFMDRLLPHLQRACRIGLKHFVYSTQALVGQLLVNKLRQPVILATPGGEVMHTNEAAQQLLRSTPLVKVQDGRVQLPQPHHGDLLRHCAEMEQAIKIARADPAGAEVPAASMFRSLTIRQDVNGERAPEALYAFFSMLAPEDMMGSFGLRPVVMLIFYHPASAPSIDSGLLYAVFGLTPAECRVATLLAEGLPVKRIAEIQGTQHDTVRKQLRSIYQKTATNRQPELVRLLLHLPHNAVQN
ncbi:helix-turn-helix transcriptional regulator [Ramlibacter sp.]|uniref:helix-turn-helix transcriptional regulator n=1 Tax=Ramlibacter sp. TaxID=1917967 RepID=UPI002D5655AC|nr:helix-turn-helix transcriptional regulator [Ramlibacter sp.]HYD76314.1 helix-turn-helix transcriptional regulator [Ramlibacter sp.]